VAEIFPADLSISSSNFTIGVSPDYTEELRGLPEIAEVTTLNQTQIRLGDDVYTVTAIEPATSRGVLFVGAGDAELEALERTNGLLVHVDQPSAAGQVGTIVLVELPNGTVADAEIVGMFDDSNFGEYLMTRDRFVTGIDPISDGFVLANAAEGTTLGDAQKAAETAATPFPNVEVQTGTELVDEAKAQIDAILVIFTALLLLAIIIAILGITNTLALSIIERTREIGLLRAIGMSRRQLRRMIRWEAVIIAVFGAILGMLTGIVLGWAVVQALKDEGLGDFAIPFGQLVILVFVAGIAGVFAAIYPAYKASRLNILEAIAYE
jgi:putative ABC transport system permease protein